MRDIGVDREARDTTEVPVSTEGRSMSQSVRRGHLEGLAAAIRFARIPLVCAAIVALVNSDPIGRALAIVLGAVFIAAGVALNAGQIFLGRPGNRSVSQGTTLRA